MGELRVVLTKRSSQLKNFPGHIALPGGKADNGLESEWQVSRREMYEEIGLHSSNEELYKLGLTIDHMTTLPSYLSRTFSCVKPCIGLLRKTSTNQHDNIDITSKLNIVLNPGESSSIFSCPLRDFLYPNVDEPSLEALERVSYKVKWGGIPWDLRSYTFLQSNPNEAEWLKDIKNLSSDSESSSEYEEELEKGDVLDKKDKEETTPPSLIKRKRKKNLKTWGRLGSRKDDESNEKIYDVWGLTANILHDLSEIVYLGKEVIENREIGQEEMIYGLYEFGNQMKQKERSEDEVKLIHATHTSDEKQFGFHSILPSTEFNRLKNIYKL